MQPAPAIAAPSRKIVFVNRFFFPDHSATSQLLSDLAFHLADNGFDVHVVTSRQRYGQSKARLPAREVVRGVHVHRVWTSSFGRAQLLGRAIDYVSFYIAAAAALASSLKKADVVIAKTDPPLVSIVAAAAAGIRGAYLINWLQDIFPEVAAALAIPGMDGRTAAALRKLRNWSLRRAEVNIALGDRMATYIGSQGIPQGALAVIHNWADGKVIRPLAQESNQLRLEWQLADKFVVAYSGNMGRAHEFGTILGAAQLLKHQPRIAFVFIGDGQQRTRIAQETRYRKLTNVMFKPYQSAESLGSSLGAADLHLVSLKGALEGLIVPSKFYGVAAAGRPCLFVGDVRGEIAALIREHNCGMAIAEGDAEGLARAIEALAQDAVLCAQLGRNARIAFERRWDKKIAVAAWQSTLTRLLQQTNAACSPTAQRKQ